MALDTVTDPIDNASERLDSRGIIARIEDMEECIAAGEIPDADQVRELAALRELADEGAGIEGWDHGVTLIRDNWFVEYAKEYFDDTSEPETREVAQSWPFKHIDWDAAADDLQSSFTDVTFDGVTYWCH
jgi:hypothetical protein